MAKRRRVGNLLALAVLSAVTQRSMHPYEMGRTLRAWGKDQDMAIKWGSLYTVVGNLEKHGLLVQSAFDFERLRRARVEGVAARAARINHTKAPWPAARLFMRAMLPMLMRTAMNPEVVREDRYAVRHEEAA